LHYEQKEMSFCYGMEHTNSKLDYAYQCFHEVKKLTVTLVEVENGVYRLANAIRKSQKRANALKNIVIPGFEHDIKFITEDMEEKERKELTRQKVIKQTKLRKETSS